MRFDLTIVNGVITVDCDVDNYEPDRHFTRLLVRASDLASANVALAAFSMGLGATAMLQYFETATGLQGGLVMRDRPLEAICDSFSPHDESFDQILQCVYDDFRLSRAVRDLTESIGAAHLIPSLCARAIETLRVLMVPPGIERQAGWAYFRSQLNLSQPYLKSITDRGVAPRHGDHEYVAAEDTRMIADRSWTIMNRYFEYLKREKQALPLDQFPLLPG
jgi:hypothetical protein